MSKELRLKLAREMVAFQELIPAVAAFLEENQVPANACYAVNLALEEMLLNLIEHSEDSESITVTIDANAERLSLSIEDDGQQFDPRWAAELDVDAPLEERRAGGMGIHLVRSMFDRIDYSREEGINRLELELKLASESVGNN